MAGILSANITKTVLFKYFYYDVNKRKKYSYGGRSYILCITNMLLHGLDNPQVFHDNTLLRDVLDYGWDSAYKMLIRNTKYDSLPWLSRFWMYFPVPVAGAGMIIFELEQLYQHIRAFFIKDEKEVAA